MKKTILTLLATLALAGCGGSSETSSEPASLEECMDAAERRANAGEFGEILDPERPAKYGYELGVCTRRFSN